MTNKPQTDILTPEQKERLYQKRKAHIQMMIKKWGYAFIRAILVVGICYVILYPLMVKLVVAFMPMEDLSDPLVKWIPKNPTLANFKLAMLGMQYGLALFNTGIVTVGTTILQVVVCTMSAYAYAKMKFPGSKILFALTIFTLIVPPQTYMIATYIQFRSIDFFGIIKAIKGTSGLTQTWWPFFLMAATGVGVRSGLYIYIMRQCFRGMPVELEEAAFVDGASPFKTFYRVMVPNVIPSMLTIAMFAFVWQWNDYFFTNLLSPGMMWMTNSVASLKGNIGFFTGTIVTNPIQISALNNSGAFLSIIPIVILFIAVQRFFIQGVERSGIVG